MKHEKNGRKIAKLRQNLHLVLPTSFFFIITFTSGLQKFLLFFFMFLLLLFVQFACTPRLQISLFLSVFHHLSGLNIHVLTQNTLEISEAGRQEKRVTCSDDVE